ncbi:hypothetical protein BVRB_3g062750 [Beta vulgaris subsp. vulgaris]|nr:hypothetical protein BVRB_3g062750 [Beta vulgaris subsp. vulgaris]
MICRSRIRRGLSLLLMKWRVYMRKAFNEAISELDTMGENSYKDNPLIMQLQREPDLVEFR